MTPRTTALVIAAIAASATSCALLIVQGQEAHHEHYWYMAWNLLLAWIPMVLATVFGAIWVQRPGRVIPVVLFVAWLLFLPNAPYMATDVTHLRDGPAPPAVHYVMFAAFAATGLLLGLGSAYVVHCALLHRWNRRRVAALIYGSLVLCGIGIYLGRVVQSNSWDVLVAPDRFARAVGSQLDTLLGVAHATLFVGVAAGSLVVTYYVFSRRVGGAKGQA